MDLVEQAIRFISTDPFREQTEPCAAAGQPKANRPYVDSCRVRPDDALPVTAAIANGSAAGASTSLRRPRSRAPVDGPLVSLPMPRAEATGDSRRKANWEARYQAIIDTSATVFARRGYHATGITELCVANDLGKGALYHYIGSKEGLLAAIHDRVMDEVMAGADRVAEAGGSPSRQLAMLGDELLECDPSLPRSRLGLPARVPRTHRRPG